MIGKILEKVKDFEAKYNSIVPDKEGLAEFLVENEVGVVVRAEWNNTQNGKGCCSNCNRLDGIDPLATHCRYCGARIREEK